MDQIQNMGIQEELRKGTIFDNINEIIVCHDVENNIVWANKAYLRAANKPLSELRGRKCFSGWGLEKICDGCPAVLAVRTGLPHEAELTPENQPHWPKDRGAWLVRATPIRDRENRIIGAIEVAEDITERKRSEDRNYFLANMLQKASQPFAVVYPDGRIGPCNRAFEQLTGYTVKELRQFDGATVLTPPEWLPSERERLAKLHRTGEPVRYEKEYIRKDGSRVPIELLVHLVRNQKGETDHYFTFLADISERKRVEEDLRQSEEKYRILFETMTEGFALHEIITDAEGDPCDYRFLEANPAFEHQTGMRRQDLIGKRVLEVIPDIERYWIENYGRVALTGESVRMENYSGVLDRWYSVVAYQAAPGQFATVFSDISERKKVEFQLKQARDDLEKRVSERTAELQVRARQISKLASDLAQTEQRERKRLAGILHDHLQQILVGAKYAVEALAMDYEPSGDKGFKKVEDLLDEALETSRSLTMELSPPILREAGLASGLRWLARWLKERCGLETELHIDDSIVCKSEDIRVLLFQAVRELLFNVSKHAGVNQAILEMKRDGSDLIRITVTDRGVGFDPEEIWPNEGGMGFGLLSIRERLTLLGGQLESESSPKQGSCFTLTAPLEGEGLPSSTSETPMRPVPRPAEYIPDTVQDGGKPPIIRIMLVDDHHVMRQGLSALLTQKKDMQVVGEAADGGLAVEMARKLLPDVILMDFSMPVMDGVEASREIHEALPEIRIIGLSMYDEEDRAQAMLDAGAAAYVNKSGNPNDLVDLIRRIASDLA